MFFLRELKERRPTLIVVTGPTAVGKTELCMDIAKRLGIPIINADSRQIYRGLRIGTAQPTKEQMKEVEHYFVGTLQLDSYYNASMYEQDVMKLLNDMFSQGCKYALLSGGSMMYIDAVCNGIDDIPTITDETRLLIKNRLEHDGLEKLCEELKRLDPKHYEIVDKRNARRVVHALEVCHQTGKTYTSFLTRRKRQRPFHIVKVALNRNREELYGRINQRVDSMVEHGLVEEAKGLFQYRFMNSLNTVGYKEMFDYIQGCYSLEEAIERIKGNTRRYARKQITWFKKDDDVIWFHPDDKHLIFDHLRVYD